MQTSYGFFLSGLNLQAVEDVLHVDHEEMVKYGYNGTDIDKNGLRVYKLGSWYMPCWFQDEDCVARFDKPSRNNVNQLTKGSGIFGNHKFSGSWG